MTEISDAVLEKVREALQHMLTEHEGLWVRGGCEKQAKEALTALTEAIAATQPTETGKSGEFSDAVKAATLEILDLVNQGRAGKTIFQGDIAKIIQRCAQPEPRNGWQPIESAPLDWSSVMLLLEDSNGGRMVAEGFFDTEENKWSWFGRSDDEGAVIYIPIKWQPLPASPPCVGGGG